MIIELDNNYEILIKKSEDLNIIGVELYWIGKYKDRKIKGKSQIRKSDLQNWLNNQDRL